MFGKFSPGGIETVCQVGLREGLQISIDLRLFIKEVVPVLSGKVLSAVHLIG